MRVEGVLGSCIANSLHPIQTLKTQAVLKNLRGNQGATARGQCEKSQPGSVVVCRSANSGSGGCRPPLHTSYQTDSGLLEPGPGTGHAQFGPRRAKDHTWRRAHDTLRPSGANCGKAPASSYLKPATYLRPPPPSPPGRRRRVPSLPQRPSLPLAGLRSRLSTCPTAFRDAERQMVPHCGRRCRCGCGSRRRSPAGRGGTAPARRGGGGRARPVPARGRAASGTVGRDGHSGPGLGPIPGSLGGLEGSPAPTSSAAVRRHEAGLRRVGLPKHVPCGAEQPRGQAGRGRVVLNPGVRLRRTCRVISGKRDAQG
ncbi:Hypothetical predicted protein [Marmota monax]|uniref:Uncharacterized protein n=1 Tax=Marmota monax TaxID=9995 RepID=A0A5E4AK95_MARMO|nr:hypothetical protein GHT09_019969 [Marmota monax]VTJ57119.1 Hypothetical predicted protein [Marmota monax]